MAGSTVVRVGLTGGIGAGKSAAADVMRSLGATVIDHDTLARDVVAPGSVGLQQVVQVFGQEMVRSDGNLNRPALAAVVFHDEQARRQLEAITHPLIATLAQQREEQAVRAGARVVVHDIPLLTEVRDTADFAHVVVVTAPQAQRVERLVRDRGMDPADAVARIEAQASDADRAKIATVIIDNSGGMQELRAQVEAWWHRCVA